MLTPSFEKKFFQQEDLASKDLESTQTFQSNRLSQSSAAQKKANVSAISPH